MYRSSDLAQATPSRVTLISFGERHANQRLGFEDNSDTLLNPEGISEANRTIKGREMVVAVTDGKIDFGP